MSSRLGGGGGARLDSPVSCIASVSSVGGGDEGRKKVSNFNCNYFPVCLLSARLAAVGAEVRRWGVCT